MPTTRRSWARMAPSAVQATRRSCSPGIFGQALKRLNPWLTSAQMDEAQKKMESRLSTASLMQINEEKYALIRDGIPVTVQAPRRQKPRRSGPGSSTSRPRTNNHFLAIKELKIHGDLYRRRTDIVGFVNGIPLLFVELKKNTVDVQNAYTDNYTDYLDTIPHLFYYNTFLILSNGLEAKVGTLGSKYEFFHEWKRLSEQEPGSVALETMLRGICKRRTFWICWRTSPSLTTPADAPPRSWPAIISIWASTRR